MIAISIAWALVLMLFNLKFERPDENSTTGRKFYERSPQNPER